MAVYFIDNYKSDSMNYFFQSISNSFVNIPVEKLSEDFFLDQSFIDKELLNVKTALGNNDQMDISVIEVACSNIGNDQNELDQQCNKIDKVLRINIAKFDQYQQQLKDYDHQLAEFKKHILDLVEQFDDEGKDEFFSKYKTYIQSYNDALYQCREDIEASMKDCGDLSSRLKQRDLINHTIDKSVDKIKGYIADSSIHQNTTSILGKSMMDCANEIIKRYGAIIEEGSNHFSNSNSESIERIKANYHKMDELNKEIGNALKSK